MKYYVYVIESEKDKKHYIGLTENIERRIKEHNKGLTKSTKGRRPFKIVYFEKFQDILEARKREKYFKTGRGRDKLKKLLQNIPR